MKKTASIILLLMLFGSCKKGNFVDSLQGSWKVTEIQQIYTDTTYLSYPANMSFTFQSYSYRTYDNGSLIETGNFNVTGGVTVIHFQSGLIDKPYEIEENTNENQTWKSKNKILEFYLRFKLEKI